MVVDANGNLNEALDVFFTMDVKLDPRYIDFMVPAALSPAPSTAAFGGRNVDGASGGVHALENFWPRVGCSAHFSRPSRGGPDAPHRRQDAHTHNREHQPT